MIHDVVILGAGPAGISCALELAQNGIHSLIIDENPAPGGQIYRGIEQNQSNQEITNWLGVDYQIGNKLISEAKDNHNIEWKLNVSLWDIRHEEQFCELGVLIEDRVQVIRARNVVLANGAMERPTPFKGWTLPGVMTIGAAQTALKQSGIIPKNGVVLAGQGPLFYLYTAQILEAGVKPRAVLDFSTRSPRIENIPFALSALVNAPKYVLKGLYLRNKIKRRKIPHYYGVDSLSALGEELLTSVEFKTNGASKSFNTDLLLVHDGVVPNTHVSMAAGCEHYWSQSQSAWLPKVNQAGQSSLDRIWISGDGVSILGAEAAKLRGKACAQQIEATLKQTEKSGKTLDRKIHRLQKLREFLDREYAPAKFITEPDDETLLCRCESISAGTIRKIIDQGCMGPNQLRAFCRAGMGPCMGRQCGLSIGKVFEKHTGYSVADIGHFSVRTPLKPLTIEQLATLETNLE